MFMECLSVSFSLFLGKPRTLSSLFSLGTSADKQQVFVVLKLTFLSMHIFREYFFFAHPSSNPPCSPSPQTQTQTHPTSE